MGFDHRSHIYRHDLPLLNHNPTVDYCVMRLLESTEQRSCHRIVQCTRVIHRVQIDAKEPSGNKFYINAFAPRLALGRL